MIPKIFIGLIAIGLSIFMLTSCNTSDNSKTSEKELELQKKELDLKQKELELKEKELAQQSNNSQTKTDKTPYSNASIAETSKNLEQIQKNNEVVSNSPKLSIVNFGFNDVNIEGCSCFLSESKQSFKNDRFIFASNRNNIAFVKINNKIIKLNLQEGTSEKEIYSNKTITVEINLKIIEGSYKNEGAMYEGTILISTKDGQNITKKIIGSCGC